MQIYLDSVLSDTSKWRSSYTRALALRLCVRESIKRDLRRPERRPESRFDTRAERRPVFNRMTKALHQYSTIRSSATNLFDRSCILDLGLDTKPVLCQVEFEVFGDVSGIVRLSIQTNPSI